MNYLWIALGSALGGCARYALGAAITQWLGPQFPWGTFTINVLGCLAIGAVSSALESVEWRLFLMVGLCGGFTTFSSFGLETLQLIRTGHPGKAFAYIGMSVLIGLLAVWIGHVSMAGLER